jgi:hypothetical protein
MKRYKRKQAKLSITEHSEVISKAALHSNPSLASPDYLQFEKEEKVVLNSTFKESIPVLLNTAVYIALLSYLITFKATVAVLSVPVLGVSIIYLIIILCQVLSFDKREKDDIYE